MVVKLALRNVHCNDWYVVSVILIRTDLYPY